MATLEGQYKRYIQENPDSTFTYDDWLKWFGERLVMASENYKNRLKPDSKRNEYRAPTEMWGPAITYTYIKEDGTMWVGNDEYETQVNYCPMTGQPAPKQMILTDKSYTNE